MPFQIPASDPQQPKLNLQIDKFDGVNLLVKDARTKSSEAVEALNLIQVEDGVWTQRWGTASYGSALPGDEHSVINGASEYVSTDDANNEIRQIIAVIDGIPYASDSTVGVWNKIDGAIFDPIAKVHFLQLGGEMYIYNGIDPLALYDGSALYTHTGITTPQNLTGTLGEGLQEGGYRQFYQVTAINDVGETEATQELELTTNKERDLWNADENEYIDLAWDEVDGAVGYQIYWSDVGGHETLLARTTTNQFKDDATLQPNPFVDTPDDNTTGAPIFTSAWISDNAIFATNDRQHPYRVYRTGTGVNQGRFSAFYDGFWIDLERGGREKPKVGRHYQSGQGEGRSTVLCSTPEGHGSVWQITVAMTTVGEDSFPTPSAYKIIGSVGTEAVDGVINVENDVFFPNKQGVYALGPEKNYFGILRTNNLAALIITYWRSLPGNKIKDIAAYYYDSKVLISVSTDGVSNNRTIIYDRERLRWYADWSIGFKSFFEFTDPSGNSHLLGIHETGNTLSEISELIRGDNGKAFKSVYMSGRIPINKIWTEFGKVKKAYIKLGRPQGSIEFAVYGTQKKKGYTALASQAIISALSASGMGWDMMGSIIFGLTTGKPSTFSESSDIRYLKVNKKIRDIQFRVSSESLNASWMLLGLIAKGFKIGSSDPSVWKLKKV